MKIEPARRHGPFDPRWRLSPGLAEAQSAVAVAEAERAGGKVKWFNASSGYGFIEPDGGGADLYVHRTSMSGDLRVTAAEGDRVEFEAREGGMGPEAINVGAPG